MKKRITTTKLIYPAALGILAISTANAQQDTSTFKPGGHIYAETFGDYYVKAHSDSVPSGSKTTKINAPRQLVAQNQYSNVSIPNYSAFNFRRIYLGYLYDFTPKITSDFTFAYESGVENTNTTLAQNTSNDPSLTSDGKRSVYIKFANLRFKDIIPNADLVVGQQRTPTAVTIVQQVWGYRSVEKTISDMHSSYLGTNTTDFGAGLFGHFDSNHNFGYDVLVGNGNSAKLETNTFKKVYTDLYAWLFDKKVVIQANYDYDRTQLTPYQTSRSLLKGFVAYTSEAFTLGVEAFTANLQNYSAYKDQSVKTKVDTTGAVAVGVSVFLRGRIVKDKLGYFARYDFWNPDTKFNSSRIYTLADNSNTIVQGANGTNVSENFFTAGLDWTIAKNVHLLPNVWFDQYTDNRITTSTTAAAGTINTLTAESPGGSAVGGHLKSDYDLVFRITFSYLFPYILR